MFCHTYPYNSPHRGHTANYTYTRHCPTILQLVWQQSHAQETAPGCRHILSTHIPHISTILHTGVMYNVQCTYHKVYSHTSPHCQYQFIIHCVKWIYIAILTLKNIKQSSYRQKCNSAMYRVAQLYIATSWQTYQGFKSDHWGASRPAGGHHVWALMCHHLDTWRIPGMPHLSHPPHPNPFIRNSFRLHPVRSR